MKNIKRKIVATVLLLLCTLTMSAFEVDGISYSIREGRYAEVTNGKYCSGDVTIPNKVVYEGNEYVVESIGNSAFDGNNLLTSVNLPNSVVSIGKWAFYGCI